MSASTFPQANQSEAFPGLVAQFRAVAMPIPGWRLLQTLDLDIEQGEGGGFSVSTPRLPMRGYGNSIRLAVRNYWQCLAEYFEIVEASAQAGDPHDAGLLRQLSDILVRSTMQSESSMAAIAANRFAQVLRDACTDLSATLFCFHTGDANAIELWTVVGSISSAMRMAVYEAEVAFIKKFHDTTVRFRLIDTDGEPAPELYQFPPNVVSLAV